jgi:branched-chain amino acid aminotransferase
MAVLPIHTYFVYDDEIKPVSQFVPAENEGGIYEVLRVINGVPLFLEDHMLRFFNSAQLADKTIRFTEPQIRSFLNELITRNKIADGNVLISCKIHLKAFFIPHKYPSPEMYREGVNCGILKAERDNPNAKVFQTTVRQQADQLLAENSFYEVLLIDHHGFVTEGSRSNVFFVADDKIFTAPGNQVLLGITRQKAIETARNLQTEVIEKQIHFSEIEQFDAAFITGTSPKILPIRQINEVTFNAKNDVVMRLMQNYNKVIEDYIQTFKSVRLQF